jgi:hypothetical protein
MLLQTSNKTTLSVRMISDADHPAIRPVVAALSLFIEKIETIVKGHTVR